MYKINYNLSYITLKLFINFYEQLKCAKEFEKVLNVTTYLKYFNSVAARKYERRFLRGA